MTKADQKKAAAMTAEDIEALVREMCLASVRNDEAVARMNEELARVREQYEPEISATAATWSGLFETVQAWAAAHPEQFTDRKSIVMVHGTVGYHTGQPTLKPIKGMTWEKVVEVLKQTMPGFVRTKEEADKAGLIAAAEAGELGEENLRTLGLRRHQEERFFVEPNKEAVEIGKRGVA
jgi:phage host-nuclease inhibitor protein Gam